MCFKQLFNLIHLQHALINMEQQIMYYAKNIFKETSWLVWKDIVYKRDALNSKGTDHFILGPEDMQFC